MILDSDDPINGSDYPIEYVPCDRCEALIADGLEGGRINGLYLCDACYGDTNAVAEGRGWELALDERRGK